MGIASDASKDVQAWTDGRHSCKVLILLGLLKNLQPRSVLYMGRHSLNTHQGATSKAVPRYAGASGKGGMELQLTLSTF